MRLTRKKHLCKTSWEFCFQCWKCGSLIWVWQVVGSENSDICWTVNTSFWKDVLGFLTHVAPSCGASGRKRVIPTFSIGTRLPGAVLCVRERDKSVLLWWQDVPLQSVPEFCGTMSKYSQYCLSKCYLCRGKLNSILKTPQLKSSLSFFLHRERNKTLGNKQSFSLIITFSPVKQWMKNISSIPTWTLLTAGQS